MDSLLDQVETLARSLDPQVHPVLEIPEELIAHRHHHWMTLRETSQTGKGWFAVQDIPAGTLLLFSRPICMVMDWEDDSASAAVVPPPVEIDDDDEERMEEEEKEPRMNELLLLRILKLLQEQPQLWNEQLTHLFPRQEGVEQLPTWVCDNDETFLQVESLLSALPPHLPKKEIAKRLPLIIRYNVLSIETGNELLSYPTTYSRLAGVGLYSEPSFFNHSKSPNVARWAIGNLMGFCTNQIVSRDTELCISYLEADILCEPAWRRNAMLSMDFQETDDATDDGSGIVDDDDDAPDMPVVDNDVQNELMGMDALERLQAMDELMAQARGEKSAEAATQEMPTAWFQCDVHNLNILKAITLDGLGQHPQALELWHHAIAFVSTHLPPNDESLVVLHTQAALCSLHCANGAFVNGNGEWLQQRARDHADAALQIHNLLFGGGVARFRKRLQHDLELPLRPLATNYNGTTILPQDILWPLSL